MKKSEFQKSAAADELPTAGLKNKLTYISGISASLILTVTARVLSVILMNLSNNTIYDGSSLPEALSIIILFFDSLIFAAGAALILFFIVKRVKKYVLLSFASALLILTADFAAAFIIDMFVSELNAVQIPLALLNIALNLTARLISYLVIALIANTVLSKHGVGEQTIPLLSLSHPICRVLIYSFIVRVIPYIIFELYSNISAITKYGFDMTGLEWLAIITAYLEILIEGIIVYISLYLLLLLYRRIYSRYKS